MTTQTTTAENLRIPDEEFVQRINTFKEKMADHKIQMVIIFSNLLDPSAVRYFSDFSPINESAAMIIPLDGDPILCSGQACHEWSRFKSRIKDIRILPEVGEVSGVEYNIAVADFEDLFKEMKVKYPINKIGIIGDLIFPYEIYKKIEKIFPGVEKVSAEDLMYGMRMHKSENELAMIRKAGEIITQAFQYCVGRIKPGSTELDIQADVESEMLRLGAEAYNLSWAPMIPSGAFNSNLCMNRNSLRKIKESEIINVDAGALYEGYNAVICSPVVLGKIPAEIRKAVLTAWEAQKVVSSHFKPGVSSRELFKLYIDFIDQKGYKEYAPYGSVHSLGMLECESPFFSANRDVYLVENSVVAIDAYFKSMPWGSFRIEDTFIVTENGGELVTKFNQKFLERFLSKRESHMESKFGSKIWYVADGWLPFQKETPNSGYEGHEAIMILNCQDEDANVLMDVYFDDRNPVEGIPLLVKAKRIKCFRMDHPDEIGGLRLSCTTQYALRFRSSVDVIIQYGRMDVTQPNLAYIGMMGMPA